MAFSVLCLSLCLSAFSTFSWAEEGPVYGRYRVQPGDTLSSIAERLLGNRRRWKELYELNQGSIGPDPSRLKAEAILLIPLPQERVEELVQRPLETPTPLPSGPTYLVRSGDTLAGIARSELGDPARWKELYELNRETIGDDPSFLPEGTVLVLPTSPGFSPPPALPSPPSPPTPAPSPSPLAPLERRYVVQPGDTLFGIARSLGDLGRWKEIYELNREAIGPDPGRLKAGTTLVLPRPAARGYNRYTIRPGDTLIEIARRELSAPSRWKEIYELNRETIGPEPGRLKAGLSLKLPPEEMGVSKEVCETPRPSEKKPERAEKVERTYVVRSGDTLFRIARSLGDVARWKEIYELNREAIGDDPGRLKAGMVLRLPGAPLGRTRMVRMGDTLSSISLDVYGDPSLWPRIYRANRSIVGPNPSCLRPGTVLSIPDDPRGASPRGYSDGGVSPQLD